MNREEAEIRKRELAAADPAHTWLVRERDGGFEVVKVGLPGQRRPKLTTTTESAPNPQADDPRSSADRLIPPFGAGIG
ncbi:MAG: hypothetical protein QOJ57_2134 [Thermoleophilaceae bacterium]|jgi:hypothetical protein|nr:hypothetical protein [Thermoleophilaceae bacterium]